MTQQTDEQERTSIEEATRVERLLLAHLFHVDPNAYRHPTIAALTAGDFAGDGARAVWVAIQQAPEEVPTYAGIYGRAHVDLKKYLGGLADVERTYGVAVHLAARLRELADVRAIEQASARIARETRAGEAGEAKRLLRDLTDHLARRDEQTDQIGIQSIEEAIGDPTWSDAPSGFAWRQNPDSEDGPIEVLYRGTASMLAAAGGAGKSYFGLTLAAHVAGPDTDGAGIARVQAFGDPADGGWMLGVGDSEPGRALVILGEDPKNQTMLRLRRIVGVHLRKDEPATAEEVRAYFNGRLHLAAYDGQAWPVVDEAGRITPKMRRLLGIARGERMDFIFVDPAARFARPGTESSPDDATHFVGAWQRLARETGAHVMIAHHTSQASRNEGRSDATSARGTTALTDGFRSVLTLTPDGDPGDGWIKASTLRLVKTNFAKVMPPVRLSTERLGVPRIETLSNRKARHRAEYAARHDAFIAEVEDARLDAFALAMIGERHSATIKRMNERIYGLAKEGQTGGSAAKALQAAIDRVKMAGKA